MRRESLANLLKLNGTGQVEEQRKYKSVLNTRIPRPVRKRNFAGCGCDAGCCSPPGRRAGAQTGQGSRARGHEAGWATDRAVIEC